MRITQLLLSKGLGGAERYFVDLCLALADMGHDVQAICHSRFVARRELEARSGLRVQTVSAKGLWDLWSVSRIQTHTADFGPAVIHAHLARGAWAGGRVAERLGLPLVVKTHNYVKLKYYRRVDLFIPTTHAQEAFLRAEGIDAARIERIPNFSAHAPTAAPVPARRRPLVFVSHGRMVEKKGFNILLTAFADLLASGVEARLKIGGDGPQRASLAQQARRAGLAESVDFPGWVDDVSALLSSGDVFVLPSLDEPFGIALLEAMAAGLPAISTRTEGPLEVLNEDCGYLVETGDPAALGAAMRAAAADPAGRTAKAEAALARYRDLYCRDAVVPRIVALYERLATSTRP